MPGTSWPVAALGAAMLVVTGFPPTGANAGARRGDMPEATPIATSQKPVMNDGALVPFQNSPFPYDGAIPEKNQPFLDHEPDGRAFHLSPRGGKLYADTYADRRSLLYIPRRFDPRRPGAAIILFLHGNLATLADVRDRQRVPRQLLDARKNMVLVAPQLASNALDSSAGRFWQPGFFETYLHEAAAHVAERSGLDAAAIDRLPVVIVAYSGGYLATAFSLKYATAAGDSRIAGVILLDALFDEEAKFADWIAQTQPRTFFVSAYSNASRDRNERLRDELVSRGVGVQTTIPSIIGPGVVAFQAAPDAVHNDFVTQAWVRDPLRSLLSRIDLASRADR